MATHVKHNSHPIPETRTGPEGSAKRNIVRRNSGQAKDRKSGAANNVVDDGTTYMDGPAYDTRDPNYDSEEETAKEFKRNTRDSFRSHIGEAPMTLSEYKKRIEPVISEFFVSGDFNEVIQSVQELAAPQYLFEFVKKAVNMSLDKNDRERELVSQLLSEAYPNLLSSNSIGKGFGMPLPLACLLCASSSSISSSFFFLLLLLPFLFSFP